MIPGVDVCVIDVVGELLDAEDRKDLLLLK